MRETRPRKSAGGHQELPSDLQNEIENEIDDELINESINETSGAPNPLRNSLGSKRHATTLGPGDHFGEVEILKQVSETRHENRELISDIWGKRGATYGGKGGVKITQSHSKTSQISSPPNSKNPTCPGGMRCLPVLPLATCVSSLEP